MPQMVVWTAARRVQAGYDVRASACSFLRLSHPHVPSYSYVATVPLLVVFSVAMTVIKYKEGVSPPP